MPRCPDGLCMKTMHETVPRYDFTESIADGWRQRLPWLQLTKRAKPVMPMIEGSDENNFSDRR